MSKILEGIQLTEKKKKPKPTSPEKWSRAKAKARSKFDVYPSAYANAYAAKEYKKMGGGWRMGESEGDGDRNPMAVAVHRRIMRQNPQWFTKYGVDAIEYAIDEIVGEDWDGEMIYADDVSAYIDQLGQYLRDHYSDRGEMDDRKPFAEHDGRDDEPEEIDDDGMTMADRARRDGRGGDDEPETAAQRRRRSLQATRDFNRGRRADSMREGVAEGTETATEDVLSTMKKKLGDYLQDVATAIKSDPDLKDKIPQAIDQIRAVKTVKTDDGHEIKIHGNEDDGFRISIKNKDLKTAFKNLDEATMACEMYCARRRKQMENADYIEEKRS